jgi:hypothetical protein
MIRAVHCNTNTICDLFCPACLCDDRQAEQRILELQTYIHVINREIEQLQNLIELRKRIKQRPKSQQGCCSLI